MPSQCFLQFAKKPMPSLRRVLPFSHVSRGVCKSTSPKPDSSKLLPYLSHLLLDSEELTLEGNREIV